MDPAYAPHRADAKTQATHTEARGAAVSVEHVSGARGGHHQRAAAVASNGIPSFSEGGTPVSP